MAVTSLAVTSIAIGILYNVSLGQQKLHLTDMVKSQARFTEAAIEHEILEREAGEHPSDETTAVEDVTNIISTSRVVHRGFGETGEITFAKLQNGEIIFLLRHRHGDERENTETHGAIQMSGVYAEPMRRALNGGSGTVIGTDYRGERVLAAYEPIIDQSSRLGIVAKIDMTEIQAPFIAAGAITITFSILLIFLGSVVFRRVGNPLVTNLEESEERYRSVVEQSPNAILIHSDDIILFANTTSMNILGVDSIESIIGNNISSYLPGISWEKEQNRIEENNSTQSSKTPTVEALAKPDGTKITVEVSSMPLEFKGKEGVQTIIQDISLRKRAENAMNTVAVGVSKAVTGKEFFESLVESLGRTLDSAFAFVGELDGDSIKTIAVWGDGKIQPNFKYALDHTPCQQAMERNVCGYKSHIQENFPKDQMLIDMGIESYVGARLFDSKSRTTGIIVILDRKPLTNINLAESMLEIFGTRASAEIERKKNEESLKKAKEVAENATLQKEKYLTLVTHDLRSPISTMLSYLGVIKRDTQITKKEKTLKAIDQSEKVALEMISLIDEILNIGRFKSGQMGIYRKFISAYFVAAKVIDDLKILAEEKGIQITNDVNRSSRLYADPALFKEVIKNLVANSIKFCGKGNKIRLYTPTDNDCTIAIEDDGVGISKKKLKDLFSFEKKTNTTGTAGETGHGLGLPFSREIIETHGGTLKVESNEGIGCTFFAELPYNKPKVLLVDDEPNLRFIYRNYLEEMELDIHEAENGKEALRMIESEEYHLVITDISMPIMDGFTFMTHLKGDSKTENIPIIVLTSDSSLETRTKVLQMGADDFSSKMVKPNEFLPRVSRFLA